MKSKKFNKIYFRPISDIDLPFLIALYASTRVLELSTLTDWSKSQKKDFIKQQFNAQHHHYLNHYHDAQLELIVFKQKTIGRLYVHRKKNHIQLMDITLSPDWRNKGIGSYLISQLMQESQLNTCTLELYVEPYNPALNLYQRLGFIMQEVHGAYYRMQWKKTTAFDSPHTHLGDIL